MDHLLLNGTVVALGLAAIGLAWLLIRRPASDPGVLKFLYFLAAPLLFQFGYAVILTTFGLDGWTERIGWDTWLGFGLAALMAVGFAVTRFRGPARVVLTLLGLGWIAYPLWLYLSAK